MKTTSPASPNPRIGFFAHARFILTAFCVAMVAIAAAPTASAAGANGKYKLVNATGVIKAGGETMRVDKELIKQFAALQDERITISRNTLRLNRNAALRLVRQLEKEVGLKFKTKLTGPTSLKLRKSGRIYKGATKTPIALRFSTVYEGQKIAGNLKSRFQAQVKGKTLTLKVPITGVVLGMKIKGNLNVICKR